MHNKNSAVQNTKANPSRNGFLAALAILALLMAAAGALTRLVPAGAYQRQAGTDGIPRILADTYERVERPDYPFWRILTAPFEVLISDDAATAIVIGLFIIVVGGSFGVLEEAGLIKAAVTSLSRRFMKRRYLLLMLICFIFMAMGSVMGVFEELVPLVPLTIALATSLGWDVFTGMAMSILAVGFGFSAGIANPFTVGTAQKLAGVPLMSGAGFRILIFCVVYSVYMAFLLVYVRRLEKPSRGNGARPAEGQPPRVGTEVMEAQANASTSAGPTPGLRFFAASGLGLMAVVVAMAITRIGSDFLLPLVALGFVMTGAGSGLASGLKPGRLARAFARAGLAVAPAFALILMALSVKVIIVSGGIMDTILHAAAASLAQAGPYQAAAILFGLTLGMNFFIGSASGKAFLLIPILAPLAGLSGLSPQLAVQAFIFGDGFSNMIYPTNAVLLVSLGLAGVSWPQWVKKTWLLQVVMLLMSLAFLFLAVAIGYT